MSLVPKIEKLWAKKRAPVLIVNPELALSLVLRASSCGVEKKSVDLRVMDLGGGVRQVSSSVRNECENSLSSSGHFTPG